MRQSLVTNDTATRPSLLPELSRADGRRGSWFGNELEELTSRTDAFGVAAGETEAGPARSYYERILVHLRTVNSALHESNTLLAEFERSPWRPSNSPLLIYLSSTYIWCSDVVRDVTELATLRSRFDWEERRLILVDSAREYIVGATEPLVRQFHARWRADSYDQPAVRARPVVEVIQSEVMSLLRVLDMGTASFR